MDHSIALHLAQEPVTFAVTKYTAIMSAQTHTQKHSHTHTQIVCSLWADPKLFGFWGETAVDQTAQRGSVLWQQ